MFSVAFPGTKRLVVDVISSPSEGSENAWVCVRAGQREPGKGWLGCWRSESSTLDDGNVNEFIRALSNFLSHSMSDGPNGPALTDYLFYPGWTSWGPGIPRELERLAAEPSPSDPPPLRLQELD